MLAGKVERFANMATKRRVVGMLCCLLLMFSLTGFTFSAPANLEPEIAILGSNVQTYDLDALQWEFPLTLVGFGPGARTARLAEFSIDGHDMLRNVSPAQRTMTVHRLDDEIDREAFRNWNNYRQRASVLRVRNDERISLSAAESRDFREGNARMRGVMGRRGEMAPVVLPVNISELPFRVAADGHYRVRAVVERGGTSTTWEGEVLIVDVEPLATNPFWTPADLHLHSTFALDGRFEPRELAPMLANRGYVIGYITDEPAGRYITTQPIIPRMSGTGRQGRLINGWVEPGTNRWLVVTYGKDRVRHLPYLATWETYRDTVRAASTTQVAMFPGAEIAASTINRTHTTAHDGHALAHGIQNLIGVGTAASFDTTGLRYSWFLPGVLLGNINNNRLGRSSASIAHPVGFQIANVQQGFPWNVWDAALPRYDGFELMHAGQFDFSPGSTVVNRWRREIVANLTRVFTGNGFPSARTGSDWGGAGSEFFDISYFTFVGLASQPPSDRQRLAQSDVDAALRTGRTVASRLGGIAALRLRNTQGVLQEIGSRFTMPPNAIVSGDIVLRAARSGSYRVRIIQNFANSPGVNAVPAFAQGAAAEFTQTLSAGQTIVIPVSFPFAGGQRAFHVVVEHSSVLANDTIYTSPIFIRE